MVALGCRTRLLSGRGTQSAFGYARLDLVLLYVRRRSTTDHGNKSGSTYTEITEPSLTQSQPAVRVRRTLREGGRAFTSVSARYCVSNREEQNKSIARIVVSPSRKLSRLTWWSSAVNRSFVLCLAACRRRSSAWLTRARFSARCVLCWPAFPSIPALRSRASAAGRPALFGAFTATTTEPDFSKTPCQTVTYPSRPSCAMYREASSRVELRRSRCFVARLRKCPARPGSDGSPTLQLLPAVHQGRPDRRVCRRSPYRSPPCCEILQQRRSTDHPDSRED